MLFLLQCILIQSKLLRREIDLLLPPDGYMK
jgi:hypothetical protein